VDLHQCPRTYTSAQWTYTSAPWTYTSAPWTYTSAQWTYTSAPMARTTVHHCTSALLPVVLSTWNPSHIFCPTNLGKSWRIKVAQRFRI